MLLGDVSIGMITHLAPYASPELTGPATAMIMLLFGVSWIVGRLACGVLMDRLHAPRVAAGFVFAMALLSSILLARMDACRF